MRAELETGEWVEREAVYHAGKNWVEASVLDGFWFIEWQAGAIIMCVSLCKHLPKTIYPPQSRTITNEIKQQQDLGADFY